MAVLTLPFTVRHTETGTGARLTPTAFLDLFQEAAGVDAQQRGFSLDDLAVGGIAWVLNRLAVRFDAPLPRLGETLTLTTWPTVASDLYANREFVAHDAAGGRLVTGSTRWVMIDVARRRPVRIPPEVAALAVTTEHAPLVIDAGKLPAPRAIEHAAAIAVQRRDLDANGHTNNVRYAEWALEALPDSFLAAHRLAFLDLVLRAETHRGDALHSEAGPDPADPAALLHRLTRDEAGTPREVASARTRWEAACD